MVTANVVDVLLSGWWITFGVVQLIEVSRPNGPLKVGTKLGKMLAGLGFICTGVSIMMLGRDGSYLFLVLASLAYLWATISESGVRASQLFPTFFGRRG